MVKMDFFSVTFWRKVLLHLILITCTYIHLFSSRVCILLRKSLSHVRLFVTPWSAAHQAPLSMGILQARILEWVAMPVSRGSSQHRDWTQVSGIEGGFFTIWATRETQLIRCKFGIIQSTIFLILNSTLWFYKSEFKRFTAEWRLSYPEKKEI